MTLLQQLITIVVAALATLITRFSPFVVFSGKKVPKAVEYLGRALPGAVRASLGLLPERCGYFFLSFWSRRSFRCGPYSHNLQVEEEYSSLHSPGNSLLYVPYSGGLCLNLFFIVPSSTLEAERMKKEIKSFPGPL